MPYIVSTMSNDVNYTLYKKSESGLMVVDKEVLVNGGANVITKALVTPEGTLTKVTDEELELLKNNAVFRIHEKNGYVKIQKTGGLNTKDLEEKDNSAQLTADDFEKHGKKAPKVKE